jgi:hypothetical protein
MSLSLLGFGEAPKLAMIVLVLNNFGIGLLCLLLGIQLIWFGYAQLASAARQEG